MSEIIINRNRECAMPSPFRLRAVSHSDEAPTNSGLVRSEDPRWRNALSPPDRYQDEIFAPVARRSYSPLAAACCGLLAVAGACLTFGRESAEVASAHSDIQAALDVRDARGADVRVPISSFLFELTPAWSAPPSAPEPPAAAVAETSQIAAPLELHPKLAPLPPRRPASLDAVASTPSQPSNPPRSIDLAWATR